MIQFSKKWRYTFIGVLLIGLAMELFAVLDHNDKTQPLTTIIVQYIPFWVGFPIIVGVCGWLIYHFYYWYKRWYS